MHINCSHFTQCSGCIHNFDVEHLESFEEAKLFFNSFGILNLSLKSGNSCGWRCRAKLAVRGSSDQPLIGLFEEGSHRVVDIPFCKVHHPLINKAVAIVKDWITQNQITLYDELTKKGFLRYLQLVVDRKNNQIQLVLVVNDRNLQSPSFQDKIALLDDLWNKEEALWHSIWVNFNVRKDNTILDQYWHLHRGQEWLWDNMMDKAICFHPGSFAQANLEMFEDMLQTIIHFIPHHADVLEYYAGVGVIGFSIVDKSKKVKCIEIASMAEKCFKNMQEKLPENLSERLSYLVGVAGEKVDLLEENSDLVIVDPPRKGLDKPLLKGLCESLKIKRIIYISCGWESFKRDCVALIEAGWKLNFAEEYLFFPGSEHLETLAVFDKLNGG